MNPAEVGDSEIKEEQISKFVDLLEVIMTHFNKTFKLLVPEDIKVVEMHIKLAYELLNRKVKFDISPHILRLASLHDMFVETHTVNKKTSLLLKTYLEETGL
jgi:hypothetical protein